jgi:hypothetical protein
MWSPGTGLPAYAPRHATERHPARLGWGTKKMGTDHRGRVPSLSALTIFGVIARAEQSHNECPQPLFPIGKQKAHDTTSICGGIP